MSTEPVACDDFACSVERILWQGKSRCRPAVAAAEGGGVVFRYDVDEIGSFECSLWCEVGERFKPAFATFWNRYDLKPDPVELSKPPWLADSVRQKRHDTKRSKTRLCGKAQEGRRKV